MGPAGGRAPTRQRTSFHGAGEDFTAGWCNREGTLEGKKSGFKGKVWVWAPKQYFDPKYANSGFPVMIALPGGPGYPNNYWMGTDLGLQKSISTWSQEGKSKPFILAMPVLNPAPDDGGLYWDGSDIPDQPKMGTWLTEDVPDLVKANFRTIKSRDGWAFMGSSTGGFAGLKAVLKHPDKFKAVIASGPDVAPDSRLWKGHEKEKEENSPKALAKKLIAKVGPDVYLAFQVGTAESNTHTLGCEELYRHLRQGAHTHKPQRDTGGSAQCQNVRPQHGRGPDPVHQQGHGRAGVGLTQEACDPTHAARRRPPFRRATARRRRAERPLYLPPFGCNAGPGRVALSACRRPDLPCEQQKRNRRAPRSPGCSSSMPGRQWNRIDRGGTRHAQTIAVGDTTGQRLLVGLMLVRTSSGGST